MFRLRPAENPPRRPNVPVFRLKTTCGDAPTRGRRESRLRRVRLPAYEWGRSGTLPRIPMPRTPLRAPAGAAHPDVRADSNGSDRDRRGRFLPGNPGGPGNPDAAKLWRLREAVTAAVTEADVRRVMRTLLRRATKGDMLAAKVFLDRVVGKTTATPRGAEGVALELPTIATTEDTLTASSAILKAMGEGRITPDDAVKLASVVEMARRTIETHDLARRIESLEETQEDE